MIKSKSFELVPNPRHVCVLERVSSELGQLLHLAVAEAEPNATVCVATPERARDEVDRVTLRAIKTSSAEGKSLGLLDRFLGCMYPKRPRWLAAALRFVTTFLFSLAYAVQSRRRFAGRRVADALTSFNSSKRSSSSALSFGQGLSRCSAPRVCPPRAT